MRGRELDPSARAQLVADSQGLVYAVARRFASTLPLDELIQEGNMGLLRAIDRFDPARGSFAAIATWWVRAFVGRAADRSGLVKMFQERGHKYVPAPISSLDVPRYEDGDETWLDELPGNAAPADEQLQRHQLRQRVRDALERLGERLDGLPLAIVEHRLMREDPLTLDVLGSRFGLSRERVRQVEMKVRELLARHLAPVLAEVEA